MNISAVKWLILVALLFSRALDLFAQNTTEKKSDEQIILFVCEHGAGRSAVAASYFNQQALKRNLKIKAIFRGVDPQPELGSWTKKGLSDDGVKVEGVYPIGIKNTDTQQILKIITIDCTLPDSTIQIDTRWHGIPVNGNYLETKGALKPKIDSLIDVLLLRRNFKR